MREYSYELYLGPEYTSSTPDEIRRSHITKGTAHSPTLPNTSSRCKDYRRPIYMLNLNGDTLAWFESIADASRKTGIGAKNICSALSKHSYTAGGFRWEYDKKTITKT